MKTPRRGFYLNSPYPRGFSWSVRATQSHPAKLALRRARKEEAPAPRARLPGLPSAAVSVTPSGFVFATLMQPRNSARLPVVIN